MRRWDTPVASPVPSVHLAAHLFVLGLAAEPALIEAQMRESAKQEPQAWTQANSSVHESEESPLVSAGPA